MEICTIGFTKHTAEGFFRTLRDEGVSRLIDVRLNNVSQLAGFAKRDDLRYFLEKLCHADYVHEPEFAPTPELLKSYRGREIDWQEYESRFLSLMEPGRSDCRPRRPPSRRSRPGSRYWRHGCCRRRCR